MQDKILTDLPPELLRSVVKKLPLSDQLNLRTASRCLDGFVLKAIKPESCELTSIIMQQLKNNVHCSAGLGDRVAGLHFAALDALKTNVHKIGKQGRRELLFTLSPTDAAHRDCALFEKAHIRHFAVKKGFPVYPSPNNIHWLKQLLRGCTIDKVSLVVDAESLPHIELIPGLLEQVRASSVEIVVQNQTKFPVMATFRDSRFVDFLSTTDVRDIAFITDPHGGRVRLFGLPATPDQFNGTDFVLLEKLARCGIMNIKMQMFGYDRDGFERFCLLPFLRTLSLASYHVNIHIKSILPIESGTKVYRMGSKYPRYRVKAFKASRDGPHDELHITTLKDGEEPSMNSVDL